MSSSLCIVTAPSAPIALAIGWQLLVSDVRLVQDLFSFLKYPGVREISFKNVNRTKRNGAQVLFLGNADFLLAMSRIVRAGNTIVTYTTTTTTTSSSSQYETKSYRSEAHKAFDEKVSAQLSGKTEKVSLSATGPSLVVWSVDGIVEEIQRQVIKFKCRLIDIFQV